MVDHSSLRDDALISPAVPPVLAELPLPVEEAPPLLLLLLLLGLVTVVVLENGVVVTFVPVAEAAAERVALAAAWEGVPSLWTPVVMEVSTPEVLLPEGLMSTYPAVTKTEQDMECAAMLRVWSTSIASWHPSTQTQQSWQKQPAVRRRTAPASCVYHW